MQRHAINPQTRTLLRNILIGVAVAASLVGLAPSIEAGHSQSLDAAAPATGQTQPHRLPVARLRPAQRD